MYKCAIFVNGKAYPIPLIYARCFMKYKIILYSLSFLFVATTFIRANDSYMFRTMSPPGGFYYDHVNSILPSEDGFVWVSMGRRLYRFDGYEHKDYTPYFVSLTEDTEWQFNSIGTDKDGNICVGTNNGMYRYSRITDTFEHILGESVSSIHVDAEKNTWLSINGYTFKFDIDTHQLDTVKYNGAPVRFVTYYANDDQNQYMATLYDRIYCYDHKDANTISLFYSFPRNTYIRTIKIHKDKIWALVRGIGIVKIDIPTRQIEATYTNVFRTSFDKVMFNDMHIDKNGKLWFGTQEGLYIFDPETGRSDLYTHSENDKFSLINNSVKCIVEDSQGNIWIGAYSGGVSYVNLNEKKWFRNVNSQNSALNHNIISCFAEDSLNLWVGTEGGGINRIDKRTGEFTGYFTYVSSNENTPSANNIKSLLVDNKNRLWISMFRGGLDCYEQDTKRFRHYERSNNGLKANDLRKILPAGNDGIWIAYQMTSTTISHLSFDGTFTHYSLDEQDKSSYIFDMWSGTDGALWIITAKKLYRFDTNTGVSADVSSSDIPYLNAQTLCVDQQNNVWVGTIGHGLIKYNPLAKSFTEYKDIAERGELTIFCIIPSGEDQLWLGTNKGLYRYNIKDNSYRRFNENDGLEGTVYYPLAAMESTSGNLYFGSTNGFTIIYPQNISINSHKPNVIISDFYIDNISALPVLGGQTSGSSDEGLVLKHTQSNFGFKFSTDSYLTPEKNRYMYRLRGYDNRWITQDGSNHTAYYSKVPAGTYYFEIAASNNDGVWNDVPTVLRIERLPSPWLSWKAYLIYTIILLSIAGTITYYYIGKKKLKMQLYLDQLDKEKKEEIHQSQLRFFTNISHDFRTPLSLILATLDNLKKEGIKEYYYQILSNNAQRLLNLANELLDFRTIENGKMKLNIEPLNINQLVGKLSSDFYDYARQRKIDFTVNCDAALPAELYADKQILEKIIMNLLNNAFKYTKEEGEVKIETYSDASLFKSSYNYHFTVKNDFEVENGFLIVIRDTGIGISAQSIQSVFERFYKVETANQDAHLGTGIGLALVKSLVLLHKGNITIYSEREKGTDMVVCLPADSSVYEQTDFLKQKEDISELTPDAVEKYESENDMRNLLEGDGMEDIMRRDKKRVLIVEDNEDLRRLLSNFLSQYYEITEAANGVEASDVLQEKEIDLILSDILMPLKDGITLCKEVKADVNTSHIPFILLTSRTGLESKIEGADSGADIYFEKPIDFSLLLKSINNVFAHQHKIREYYARNYYVDSAELSANEQDNAFLKQMIDIIDANLTQPNIDVNYIASELSMSRSKLYSKVKTLTDKSIVEFILNYRLRKAARLIIEQDMPMYQVMEEIGLKSQSYFIRVFKKEFGETPTAFAAKNKKKNS